ncbi:MAG: pyridoxamine 5'-phosphate oxidase family protein [Actinomycetota bacterium]
MTQSATPNTTQSGQDPKAPWRPDPATIERALARRSFANLATASVTGRPHVAGVLYAWHNGAMYASTMRSSRKARNIQGRADVAVTVLVRRLPVGPPSLIQFQGRAELLASDGPEIRRLVEAGHLTAITGHGELDLSGGCFVKITPGPRLITYGLGMSLWRLIRDPLTAGGVVER